MHRNPDRPDQPTAAAAFVAGPPTGPDFSRTDLQRPERMARIGEAPEPNFATKNINLTHPTGDATSDPVNPGLQPREIGSAGRRLDDLERRLDALALRFEALESTFHQNSPYSQIADAPGVRPPAAKS